MSSCRWWLEAEKAFLSQLETVTIDDLSPGGMSIKSQPTVLGADFTI